MIIVSALAVFVMLLWAICYPLIALSIPFAPVMLTAFLRALLAGILLILLAMLYRRPLPKSLKSWIYIGAIGISATAIGFWAMFSASLLLSPGLATVLASTQPLFASLLGWFFLQEHLHKSAISAIFLGFFGILIISAESLFNAGNQAVDGIAYVVIAATGIAISNILLKQIANKIDIFYGMGFQLLIGSIPLGLLSYAQNDFNTLNLTTTYTWLVSVMVVFGTALPFILWFWLMSKAPLYKLNVFSFLSPVFAIYLGVMYFSESLSLWQWLGIIIVGLAIFLTAKTTLSAPPAEHKISNDVNSAE